MNRKLSIIDWRTKLGGGGLRLGIDHKIKEAYALYRDRSLDTTPKGPAAVNFRNTYGDRVPIKAWCCWHTVASMGPPDLLPDIKLDAKFNERYAFHDTKINLSL